MLAQRVQAQEMPKPGKRDWAKEIPVMRIGLLGGENDADRLARVDGYKKLMESTFEVPVKLLVAADYAGVIQAFGAKQLEVLECVLDQPGHAAVVARSRDHEVVGSLR